MLRFRFNFRIKLSRANFSRLNNAELRKRLVVEISGRFNLPCVFYTSEFAHVSFVSMDYLVDADLSFC